MFSIAIRISIRSRGTEKRSGGSRPAAAGSRDVLIFPAPPAFFVIERRSARSTMQIVRAKPEEAAALTEIAFAAKRHWGYPESWIQLWADVLTVTPELITRNPTFSAIDDGRVVGFYSLTTEPRPDLNHLWICRTRWVAGSVALYSNTRCSRRRSWDSPL